MSDSTLATKKTRNAAYYIKSIIGLAIMLFFGQIPAPEPMTQLGMIVLGQFLGLIFLWTFVDMVWPTFAAIILFGFIAQQLYPNSFAMAGGL
jgi:sodium-dependent dicarboxylate transporter 2/3/5